MHRCCHPYAINPHRIAASIRSLKRIPESTDWCATLLSPILAGVMRDQTVFDFQEDTFNLWTMIVSNELLKNTNLILFLNKIDILRSKLASGIKFRDYVISYGNRPNDVGSSTACEPSLAS